MQSKILIALSDDNFRAEAFADYIADCNQSYANMIACINDIITTDIDTSVQGDDDLERLIPDFAPGQTDETIETVVAEKLQEYGLTGSMSISLPSGYTTLTDLCEAIATQTYKDGCVTDENGADALTRDIRMLKDNQGNYLNTPNGDVSVSDILSSIREQFHASVVLHAAALSSVYEDVTARLTVFKETVAEKFENVYSDVSNTYNYFKRILEDKGSSVQGVMRAIFDSLGVKHLAEDNGAVLNDADVSQFTGINPVASLDFSSAAKAVSATGKIVAGAVYAIGKFIFGIGKKIFNWCKNKVQSIVVNPWDIKVLNSSSNSYTLDGWALKIAPGDYEGGDGEPFINWSSFPSTDKTAILNWLNENQDHWYKMNLLPAEILFRIIPDLVVSDESELWYHMEVQFKLKPLNYSYIIPALVNSGVLDPAYSGIGLTIPNFDNTENVQTKWSFVGLDEIDSDWTTFGDYENWVEAFGNVSNCNELYIDIAENNEMEIYAAYCFSATLLRFIVELSNVESYIPSSVSSDTTIDFSSGWGNNLLHIIGATFGNYDYFLLPLHGDSAKNSDFLNVASGYDFTNEDFNSKYIGKRRVGDRQLYIPRRLLTPDRVVDGLSSQLIMQRFERNARPLDYPFVPYKNNTATFAASRFCLVTDSEHQDILTRFLTLITAVVIIAVVGVTATIVIKKLARKRFWKMTEFIGKSDNAMWNGQSLSKKDKRKYIRYSRKLNASTLLIKGIQEVGADDNLRNNFLTKLTNDGLNIIDDSMGTNFSSLVNDMSSQTTSINSNTTSKVSEILSLIDGR